MIFRPSLRRLINDRAPLLVLTVGVFIYGILLLVVFLSVPGDGVGVYVGDNIQVRQTPPTSLLRSGDVLLGIGSREVNVDLLQPDREWIYSLSSQESVPYTVLRDGERFRFNVTWRSPRFVLLLMRAGTLYLTGLSSLACAAIMLRERDARVATRLLAMAFVMLALNQINNAWATYSANLLVGWAWLFLPVDFVSISLFVSLSLHSLLLFPEIKRPIRQFIWIPWLIHLSVPLLSFVAGWIWGGDTILEIRDVVFAVANPLFAIQLGLSVISLAHTYVTSRAPGVRNQIRWILWGAVVAFVPYLTLFLIPSVVRGSPLLPLSLTNITVVLIPLSFVGAIFRQGLMEIDLIINRTLIYTILIVLLLMIYMSVGTLAGTLLEQWGMASGPMVPGILAALTIIVLFDPLRQGVRRLVERTLYRPQLDFRRAVQYLSRELSNTIVMGDIVSLLTREAPEDLGLTSTRLLLLDESENFYVDTDDTLRFPTDSPLVTWMRAHRMTFVVYKAHRLAAETIDVARDLHKLGVELCFPLYHYNRLTGLYLVGGQRSGDLPNRRQVDALFLLAQQAAAALQNARLYHELQDYSRDLEGRVLLRTHELREERNRLDTIVQNIADGLIMTDPEGRIVLVNPAFLRIVGCNEREITGKHLLEVLPLEGVDLLLGRALRRPRETFALNLFDERGLGRNSSRVYRATACALVQRPPAGPDEPDMEFQEISGVVTLFHDITHDVEVDRMKTDFITMVSHELRTPLTSVLGFAKIIRRVMDRDIAPLLLHGEKRASAAIKRVREDLEIILNEGERLTRLINDVLDVAKMESGRIEWHLDEVDINDVVAHAVTTVASLTRGETLPLQVLLPENLPTVRADRDRLIQVVTNLLSNAIKFTDKGYIEVRAAELRVSERGEFPASVPDKVKVPPLVPGSWLLVSVRDTGIGIADEHLGSVFERFQQIDDGAPSKIRGTGLGLAISKDIVEHHGGHIWVDSVKGEGSIFSFVIPIAVDMDITPPLLNSRPR